MHKFCSLKTESDISSEASNARVTHIEWKPIRIAASSLFSTLNRWIADGEKEPFSICLT